MQPGQFLTEYLDAWPKTKRSLPLADIENAVKFNTNARRNGIIFALPHGGIMKERSFALPHGGIMKERSIDTLLSYNGAMMRPPYPTCVFEFVGYHKPDVPPQNKSSKRVVVVTDRGDHAELMATAYRDVDGRWMTPPVLFRINYNETTIFEIHPKVGLSSTCRIVPYMLHICASMLLKCNEDVEEFYRVMASDFGDELWAYLDFCRMIHDNEVTFDDVEPDAKLNKMRRARGKVPLFTYKVLTIGKPKRKSQRLGGTHASPRSHLRRGCYRTSRNGVRHWVQPCMVKGDTDGFVHKDYVVEGAMA